MVLSGLRTRKMRNDLIVFKSLPPDELSLHKSTSVVIQIFVQNVIGVGDGGRGARAPPP